MKQWIDVDLDDHSRLTINMHTVTAFMCSDDPPFRDTVEGLRVHIRYVSGHIDTLTRQPAIQFITQTKEDTDDEAAADAG